jgi:hypothetical protein
VDAVTVNAGETTQAERGLGLGGLVRYSADVRVYDNGKIMEVIVAQPIDPRYGPDQARPVDDPIGLEIDIKPPDWVCMSSARGPELVKIFKTRFFIN